MTSPPPPFTIWVPGSSDNGSIYVSWPASTVPGVTYVLEEATSDTFGDAQVVYSGPALNKMLYGRDDGSYYYQVKTVKDGNEGAYRSGGPCTVAITAPLPPFALWTPSSSNTGSIYVSWPATTTPGVEYVLEEATDSGFTDAQIVYQGTERNKMLYGRDDGTYYYRIKAVKGTYESPYKVSGSNPCIVTVTVVQAPFALWTPTNSADGSISISWPASNTASVEYVLEESTSSIFSGASEVYRGTGLNTTLTGRTTGSYYYRIKAEKGAYASGYTQAGTNPTVVP